MREIVLVQDNARRLAVNILIGSFRWEELHRSLYGPDLVPSDYDVFLYLKKHLGGYDDVKKAPLQWLSNPEAD